MPDKIYTENYSGGLTKAERQASAQVAQDIRDWRAAAPARRAALLPGRGGQGGFATLGLMVGLAIVGAILSGSADARSIATPVAGIVVVDQVVTRGTIAAVGKKGATAVVGGAAAFALFLCGDQGGACESQETEKLINERIEKEFPGAYNSPEYCFLGHWPCIEAFTGEERGPGYEEAREKVLVELNEEARKKKEEDAAAARSYAQYKRENPEWLGRFQ